ncbi:P27 family phage terminase small subunit [Latilactobacillus curvatus]|uniref:P27 family phage terminase small subunit n=1 Tax=Latilactobacillus curvatus TaxID=28038 RepID=UPI0028B66301|nr:P27 family phage terminase small subunit [Latilactobacillus curvatus]MDT7016353.1 P27 family phage terminase small subunit [Latilactobacillus curvatus]
MGRKTKKQIATEEIEKKVITERSRVIEILNQTDTYSILLDPLIDSYIDAFRVYEIMYKRWCDKGFPETDVYENKNGAKNAVKHPLSVQVDIWSEKKLKALERLGMTNKSMARRVITGGTTVDTSTGHAEADPGNKSAVVNFKDKWKKKRGNE